MVPIRSFPLSAKPGFVVHGGQTCKVPLRAKALLRHSQAYIAGRPLFWSFLHAAYEGATPVPREVCVGKTKWKGAAHTSPPQAAFLEAGVVLLYRASNTQTTPHLMSRTTPLQGEGAWGAPITGRAGPYLETHLTQQVLAC